MGERQSLRQCEAADVLGYSVSSFRRLVKAGKVPGPIDPSLPPKLRRWSRPQLERYVTPYEDAAGETTAASPALRVVDGAA